MSRKITRRQAVKASLGLVAAPMFVNAATLGRAEGVASASNRITLGFIGTGKMASSRHISTLPRFEDIHTLAVCDVDSTRSAHAKRRVANVASARTGVAPAAKGHTHRGD